MARFTAELERRLARQVCEVLQQHGVAASWDGGLDRRIQIAPFAWRKRRTTKATRTPTIGRIASQRRRPTCCD